MGRGWGPPRVPRTGLGKISRQRSWSQGGSWGRTGVPEGSLGQNWILWTAPGSHDLVLGPGPRSSSPFGAGRGAAEGPYSHSQGPTSGTQVPMRTGGFPQTFWGCLTPLLPGAHAGQVRTRCRDSATPTAPPIPPWGRAPQGAMGWGPGTHGPLLPRRRPRSVSCGAPRTACPCRSTCLRTVRSSHRCEHGPPLPGGARPGWPRALGTGGWGCPAPPHTPPRAWGHGGEAQLPPAPCGAQGWDGVAGAGPHLLSHVPSLVTPRGSAVQRHCIWGFFL